MTEETRQERKARRQFQITYRDTKQLKRYISEDGKILPRRRTGLTAKGQRKLATAIKQARHLALIPHTTRD